jgi:hypothetical protein
LGLRRADCRHINTGVHQKEIAGVRAHNTKKNSGMPILTGAQKIWDRSPASFPQDNMPKLDKKGIKRVQKIVGSILYYTQAVNITVLMALSTIAVNQTKASKRTMEQCTQLLDYLAHNADAKVHFHASDMILNIHSDAFYLSEAKARSRACGHFFHGMDAPKWGPHTIKWDISRQHNNNVIRCCLHGESRTQRIIP